MRLPFTLFSCLTTISRHGPERAHPRDMAIWWAEEEAEGDGVGRRPARAPLDFFTARVAHLYGLKGRPRTLITGDP